MYWWLENPFSYTDGRTVLKGRCDLGLYVLRAEPKPGRNETVWVHMRNCLHKCHRTQVRPATNEEAEGIETVASMLPELTEAVREGRTRHFADITDEGDPEDDEPMVVEGDAFDIRLGRPDSQPEPELNANATSRSTRSGTHSGSRPRSQRQSATQGSNSRREHRFQETQSGLTPRTDTARRDQ